MKKLEVKDLKVGMEVMVRDWDDMKKEFGTKFGGESINCKHSFTTSMRRFCNKICKIVEFRREDQTTFKLELVSEKDSTINSYIFSTDMIKPIKFKVGDIVETRYGKGVVVFVDSTPENICVYHFNWNEGHNGNDWRIEYTGDHCWWFKDSQLVHSELDYKQPLLDKQEKEYLSSVIKPFRDKINFVEVVNRDSERRYLSFEMKDNDGFTLPYYKPGTMYKGLESGKEYTLEDLGL